MSVKDHQLLKTSFLLEEILEGHFSSRASGFDCRQHISGLIEEWSGSIGDYLGSSSPFLTFNQELLDWESATRVDLNQNDASAILDAYAKFCSSAKLPYEHDYWKKELIIPFESEDIDSESVQRTKSLLLNEWKKKLDQARTSWEIETIQRLRQQFVLQVKDWVRDIQKISTTLISMGLNPQDWLSMPATLGTFENGVWLCNSEGQLNSNHVERFKRWAKYLTEDENVKKICELLGKLSLSEKTMRLESVKELVTFKAQTIDANSREEIVGIKLGKDIEHALPSELALLSDPETAILFDLKYLESQLLCFEMNGMSITPQQREEVKEIMTSDEDNKGPMILCIDTSGSMQGSPEVIAKASALYLASEAIKQKRACYLINFSTAITTHELTGPENLGNLIDFLGMSFHGGTDVAPAVNHALNVMETERYEKADVLVISDFIMNSLDPSLLEKIEKQQLLKNSFNSLVIGDLMMSKRARGYFDREWVFDPETSMVDEIVNFKNTTQSHLAKHD